MADLSSDQVIQIAVDAGSVGSQLAKIKDAFAGQTAAIESFIEASAKMEKSDGSLTVTLRGLNAALEEVQTNLEFGKRGGGGAEALDKLTKASKELINVQATLAEQASRAGIKFEPTAINSIDQARAAFAALQQQIRSTADPVKTILGLLQNGTIDAARRFTELSTSVTKLNQDLLAAATTLGGGLAVQINTVTQQFNTQQQAIAAQTTALQQLVQTQNAAAKSLEALTQADQASNDALKNKKERLRDIKKDLESFLITQSKGAVPQNASTGEIAAFQRAKSEIAKTIEAGGAFRDSSDPKKTITREDALSQALDAAEKGAARLQGRLGDLQEAFLKLINAQNQFGQAADRQARADADRTQREQERADRKQRQLQKEQAAQQAAAQASQAASQRQQDANAVGQDLRAQFIQPLSTVSPTDLARIEIPIKRLQELISQGSLKAQDLRDVLATLGPGGTASFDSLNSSAERVVRSLLLANSAVAKLGQAQTTPLAQKIQSAADAMELLRTKFTAIPAAGPIDAIDSKIAQIGIKVREANIDLARFQQLVAAAGSQGGASALGGTVSQAELQIINLIRRVQELNDKQSTGSTTAATRQAEYNARLAAAAPILQQIQDAFVKQIDATTNPAKFAQLQNFFNGLSRLIGQGRIDAQKLLDVFNQLGGAKFAGGGGGGKPPPILPSGGGGEEQAKLLQLAALFGDVEKKAVPAAKSILLSWESVFRLFQVQVLHETIGQLIASFRQASDEALKFQIKISEIRTLSQENQLSVAAWSSGLRELSDSFGIPLLDVVKSAYDAISNQVVRGAQTFEFLRTVLEFSKVTVSSAADAQNLLSSAIKSYGEQNVTAGKAAEVLFKVIDLGRVTASEMANTFGRVAQLAAQTGVTIEELGASIATLTVRGVRYSEAYTLINNVLLKLIKPTEEMKKLFGEWGVASGEAAVQTFGFVGVLRLLQQEFQKGGVARLGDLEKDIRAIRGALGLVSGDAFADFEKSLNGISNGADTFKKATEIIQESAGAKLQKEFVKIQNLFSVDFGQQFIQTILDLSAPFGGLASLVKGIVDVVNQLTAAVKAVLVPVGQFAAAVGNLIPGATVATLQFLITLVVSYGAASKVVTLLITAWNFAMAQLTVTQTANTASTVANTAAVNNNAAALTIVRGLTTSLIVAGLTLLITAYASASAEADNFNNALRQQGEQLKEVRKQSEAQRIDEGRQKAVDDFNKKSKEGIKDFNLLVAGAAQTLNKFLGGLLEVKKIGVKDLLKEAGEAFADFEKKGKAVKDFIQSIQDEIQKSTKRVISIDTRGETKSFENSLAGVTDTKQLPLVVDHLRKINKEMEEIFKKPLQKPLSIEFDEKGKQVVSTLKDVAAARERLSELEASGKDKSNEAIALRGAISEAKLITPEQVEETRKRFEEVDKILDKHITQLRTARDAQEKLIADLGTKFERRQFERSLIGKSPTEVFDRTITQAQKLKNQAVDLFNKGDLEESRKKFDEIDTLIEKLISQEKSLFDRARKLGVIVPEGPTFLDNAQTNLEQTRLSLETRRLEDLKTQHGALSTLQRANNADQLNFEKEYQRIQKERLDQAITAQRLLNELLKQAQGIVSGNAKLNDTHAKAQLEKAEAQKTINDLSEQFKKQIDQQIADAPKVGLGSTFNPLVTNEQQFARIQAPGRAKRAQESFDKFIADPTTEGRNKVVEDLLRLQQSLLILGRASAKDDEQREQNEKLINDAFAAQYAKLQLILDLKKKITGADQQINNTAAAQKELQEQIQKILKDPANAAFRDELQRRLGITTEDPVADFNKRLKEQLRGISDSIDAIAVVLKKIEGFRTGQPEGRALGGRASSDTNLTWTSPDEFIVNAGSARRFAPQLRSINMGFDPARSNPGQSGVSIGDVNVTVQGGQSPVGTAREIGEAIRRELRRGTLRL